MVAVRQKNRAEGNQGKFRLMTIGDGISFGGLEAIFVGENWRKLSVDAIIRKMGVGNTFWVTVEDGGYRS